MTRKMIAANLSVIGMFVGYLNYLDTFMTHLRRRLVLLPTAMVEEVFVHVLFGLRRQGSEPRSEKPI